MILARYNMLADSSCRTCGVADSLEPILFWCTKYQFQRSRFLNNVVLNSVCFRSLMCFIKEFCYSKDFRASTLSFFHSIDRF